jgi:hypothetical protein
MGADAAPDDVCLAGLSLAAVLEGRAAVRRPSHLPYAGMSLHTLDAQPWMKALTTARKVGDELSYCLAECSLLLWVSRSQSRQNDARTSRVGIQRLGALVQRRQKSSSFS